MLQLVVELEAIERVVGRIEQANNDTLYQPSTGAILTFIHTTLHYTAVYNMKIYRMR